MRKLMLVVMLAAALVACGGDDEGGPEVETVPSPAGEDGTDAAAQQEFVIIDGGEEFAIIESCVDTSGTYKGQLDDNGLFILRGGSAPQESFVDFQPSADADPLSSQNAEDTVLASEGPLTTGTTTVVTEDGANSLELSFGIRIGEIDQLC